MSIIQQYRETHGLTQNRLAEILGKTKATVSRWESGNRNIRPSDVIEIERATGIPRHELRPDLYPIDEAAA
jgi:transcriptional regulator with XRE-family HTH domain